MSPSSCGPAATRAATARATCRSGPGKPWDGSAIDVGPGPFTYTVRVDLGGTSYVGTGTWPAGETEDIAPHAPLAWDPPLPVYAG